MVKEGGGGSRVVVGRDDGIREGTTIEEIGRLKTVFKKEKGTVTAGNTS